MRKTFFSISVIVLVCVLALFTLSACDLSGHTSVGQDLIINGDFESWTPDADDSDKGTFDSWELSDNWASSEYFKSELSTSDKDNEDFKDKLGESYLKIDNQSTSAVYLKQTLTVDRNQVYKFSVDVKVVNNLSGEFGAFVTFLENTEYTFVSQTKKGSWKTLEFFVKPANTDTMTIALSLGSADSTTKGIVCFDNASLVRMDKNSAELEGKTIHTFKKAKDVVYSSSIAGILFATFMTILAVAVVALAYLGLRKLFAKKNAYDNIGDDGMIQKGGATAKKSLSANPWLIAVGLALATIATRLAFMLTMYGFGSDMTFMVNLAKEAFENGVWNIYAMFDSAQLVSPGSLYTLTVLGAIGQNLNNADMSILLRAVSLIFDVLTVGLIYFYGKKYVGNKLSSIFALLYACLPATMILGGLGGSFASVSVFLILLSAILLIEKKYVAMYVTFALTVVFDIRVLALLPIFLMYLGYMFYKDNDSIKKVTKTRVVLCVGLVASVIMVYLLSLPVAIDQIAGGVVDGEIIKSQPFYNFEILAGLFMNNNLFVDNAFNLYAMVGMNMQSVNKTIKVLNFLFIIVFELYVVSLYFKRKNRSELLLMMSFVFAVLAVFTMKTDLTYLFLALALGFVYAMISGDKRVYAVLGTYSILSVLNITLIMNNSDFVASGATGALVNFDSLSVELILFSVIAVLTTLYYFYVVYSITTNGKIVDIKPLNEKLPVAVKNYFARQKDRFAKDKE